MTVPNDTSPEQVGGPEETPVPPVEPPIDPPAEPPADAPADAPAEDEAPPRAPASTNGEGIFYLIPGVGPDEYELVVDRGRALYERWSGETHGWVDTPYYAAYFMGGMNGPIHKIDPEEVDDWKGSVTIPSDAVIEKMRGKP